MLKIKKARGLRILHNLCFAKETAKELEINLPAKARQRMKRKAERWKVRYKCGRYNSNAKCKKSRVQCDWLCLGMNRWIMRGGKH